MKKVLVACEYSQVVTKAFREAGASAWSCDIIPCEGGHPEWHFQTDVRRLLHQSWSWDLIIAHPPCTYLARSGAWMLHKNYDRLDEIINAREFFLQFLELDCPVCVENPYPAKIADLPHWSQVVCPSEFGHKFTKHTCLWLKDLPQLLPTHYKNIYAEQWLRHCSHSGKRRAHFWSGIAEAMAAQWLPLI